MGAIPKRTRGEFIAAYPTLLTQTHLKVLVYRALAA